MVSDHFWLALLDVKGFGDFPFHVFLSLRPAYDRHIFPIDVVRNVMFLYWACSATADFGALV